MVFPATKRLGQFDPPFSAPVTQLVEVAVLETVLVQVRLLPGAWPFGRHAPEAKAVDAHAR